MKYHHLIAVSAVFISLAGCGNDNTKNSHNTEKTTDDTTTQSTKNAKTLKVAVNGNMPPFSYMDEKGNPMGFDIELVGQIAQKSGYTVNYNILPWQEMFTSVEQGVNDLAISSISYTVERDGKYSLSEPYVYLPAGILYLSDKHTINSVNDLKPLRLGIQENTIFGDFAKKYGIEKTVQKEKVFLAFQDMINDKNDAIISDKQIVQHIANAYPQYKTKILEYGDVNDKGSYAVAVAPKNRDGAIHVFNKGLKEMQQSGELKQLEQKWFENPPQATKETLK